MVEYQKKQVNTDEPQIEIPGQLREHIKNTDGRLHAVVDVAEPIIAPILVSLALR